MQLGIMEWSQWPGLNRRPTVYETVALPLSYIGVPIAARPALAKDARRLQTAFLITRRREKGKRTKWRSRPFERWTLSVQPCSGCSVEREASESRPTPAAGVGFQ